MYDYMAEKPKLFTEQGQVMFLRVRDWVKGTLRSAGCFRMQEACAAAGSGDGWTMLACVDRLVELGEIREVTARQHVPGQYRVFVRSGE